MKLDYTFIGNTVNIASRLQKAIRLYEIPILFTEQVFQSNKNNKLIRLKYMQKIKGKNKSFI